MKPAVVLTVYNEAKAGWRERDNPDGTKSFQYEDALSSKHHGNELRATIESVRESTGIAVPIVCVDDGSTDDCAAGLEAEGITVVRHKERIGIGFSRREGVEALPSDCDAVMFLDAHMRLSPGCLEHCAELALSHNAVVWPDTRGLRDRKRYTKPKTPAQVAEIWTGHGARPRTYDDKKTRQGMFGYDWIANRPVDALSRSHALISPGYSMPIKLWNMVRPSALSRGFGANDASVWVKSFFLDIPILHTCSSMVRHMFRADPQDARPYTATSAEVHRNMGLLARVCFDAKSWEGWWWPEVFSAREFTKDSLVALDSVQLMEEHLLFQAQKKRSDREFFVGLCHEPCPAGVSE